MDTSPDRTPVATGPDPVDTTGRRKLWQLDSACRERLIGSCLSARELKELCRRLGIEVRSPEADEFRRALIEAAGAPSPAARRLHKYLDRKYWPTVLRFTAATSNAALAALWRDTGAAETADASWALATHPHASGWLFGQVHREAQERTDAGGHAVRVDDWTLNCLRRAKAAFPGQRSTAGSYMSMRLSAAGRFSGAGARTTAEDRNTAQEPVALQALESLLISLRTQVEDYAAKLALERMRAERAEASAREWRQRAILCEQRQRPRGSAAAPRVPDLRGRTDTEATGRPLHVSGTG
jgi:hypothetical protein